MWLTQKAVLVHWSPPSKSFSNLIKARVWCNREIPLRRAEDDASSCQNKKNTWNTTSDYDSETLMHLPWHRMRDEGSKQHFLFGTISKPIQKATAWQKYWCFSLVMWIEGCHFSLYVYIENHAPLHVHDASIPRLTPPLIDFDYINQKLSILVNSVTICVCVCAHTLVSVCPGSWPREFMMNCNILYC